MYGQGKGGRVRGWVGGWGGQKVEKRGVRACTKWETSLFLQGSSCRAFCSLVSCCFFHSEDDDGTVLPPIGGGVKGLHIRDTEEDEDNDDE